MVGDDIHRKSRLLVFDTEQTYRYFFVPWLDETQHPPTSSCTPRITRRSRPTKKAITLDFGLRRSFNWAFTVVDVARPIIGADFLARFSLLVDLRSKKMVDGPTNHYTTGKANLESSTISNESEYRSLLKEFMDITIPSVSSHNHRRTSNGAASTKTPAREVEGSEVRVQLHALSTYLSAIQQPVGQSASVEEKKVIASGGHVGIIGT